MRLIGYTTQDKNGDLVEFSNDHINKFNGSMDICKNLYYSKRISDFCDKLNPECSPHRVVRVLIDEIEDDN